MERREYFQTINGLRLRVLEWGDTSAFPVVMMHGIRGYAETFATLAQALAPEFRVIAYDQRGRGESEWDPAREYYTDAYVSDLQALIASLGLTRYDMLGHSMGGINAMVYAAQRPSGLRRMVIEDAGPGAFENSRGATRIRGELETTPVSFATWAQARDFMRGLRPGVTEAARESRLRNMLKPAAAGGYTWRYDHAGIAHTRLNPDPARVVDLWPCVERIACSTLVLRGGASDYLQASAAEEMTRRNACIEWADIPDAGHYIHDDQPALVSRVVREFLLDGGPLPGKAAACR
ncbi:alpha/beta fold hydrolase [Pusillimonas sp. TS35]|uniref:alpha/beta fold hydrolase n=1 Tax=Paracandidimonas lactea TaxID=2895524 RepID=UPI001370A551|nr:alpha/beta hydrolase [Paracandidimonas lactea]MYN14425.1 alpha/beta fold hydrolase [Pusillimonas sp. TS35]